MAPGAGSHPRRRPSDADMAPYTPGASGAAPLQVAEGSPMAVGDALFLQRWNSNLNSEMLKGAEASQQQVVGEESEEELEEEETGSEEESESEVPFRPALPRYRHSTGTARCCAGDPACPSANGSVRVATG
jgi:hypothetical protein